jgi:hypothetical protein
MTWHEKRRADVLRELALLPPSPASPQVKAFCHEMLNLAAFKANCDEPAARELFKRLNRALKKCRNSANLSEWNQEVLSDAPKLLEAGE